MADDFQFVLTDYELCCDIADRLGLTVVQLETDQSVSLPAEHMAAIRTWLSIAMWCECAKYLPNEGLDTDLYSEILLSSLLCNTLHYDTSRRILQQFQEVMSHRKEFVCAYPGCACQYSSSDAVRKHAKQKHGNWVNDLTPTQYAVRVCGGYNGGRHGGEGTKEQHAFLDL